MDDHQRKIEELCKSAEDKHLVVVLGAGVSILLDDDNENEALTWNNLIVNGVDYVRGAGLIDDKKYANYRQLLVSNDIDSMLLVAEAVSTSLGGPSSDLFARWIAGVFKHRKPSIGKMWDALHSFKGKNIPIATLNYDTLAEQCLDVTEADFTYPHSVSEWSRNGKGVLHLHGIWTKPASCVFSIRDYQTSKSDALRNLLQQSIGGFKNLLFIGCGDTFEDPNLTSLIDFLRRTMGGSMASHYALVRNSEVNLQKANPTWRGFVEPIGYGDSYSDLPSFLLKYFPATPFQEQNTTSDARAPVASRTSQSPAEQDKPPPTEGSLAWRRQRPTWLWLAGIGLALSVATVAAELTRSDALAPSGSCPLADGFYMKKAASAWSIMYNTDTSFVMDYPDLKNLYGNDPIDGNCPNVFKGDDFFAFLAGRDKDLLVMYGVVRKFGVVTGLSRVDYFPHNSMNIKLNGHILLIQNYNVKYCWNGNRWNSGSIASDCSKNEPGRSTERPLSSIFGVSSNVTWSHN